MMLLCDFGWRPNERMGDSFSMSWGMVMGLAFPEPIRQLPEADIPLEGVTAYLSHSAGHQILFMEFEKDVDLPEHAHAAQVGFVLEGRIDLVIGGERKSFTKGDRYSIPDGVKHSAKIHAGYADITFFADPNRYSPKQ
jgi:quercetin dioxygenase-like cupin family protein